MSTPDELSAERADLARKLAIRKGMNGYQQNCQAIEARIAEIDAELAASPKEPETP